MDYFDVYLELQDCRDGSKLFQRSNWGKTFITYCPQLNMIVKCWYGDGKFWAIPFRPHPSYFFVTDWSRVTLKDLFPDLDLSQLTK